MNKYISNFGEDIKNMLIFRETVGLSNKPYETYLEYFDNFCQIKCKGNNVLDKKLIFNWLDYENQNNRHCIQVHIRTIRYFAKYLNSIGKEAYVIPEKFTPKITQYSPYLLSEEELKKLFKAIDTLPLKGRTEWKLISIPVLLRCMYTCGLRPGEAINIKYKNVNFITGEIKITHSKKYKDRAIFMSKDMLHMCQQYKRKLDIMFPYSEFLFPETSNKTFSAYVVANFLKTCWKNVNTNITKEQIPALRLYDLRHLFASKNLHKWHAEDNNIYPKLPYLKEYMGHSTLKSTLYYVHLLPDNLIKNNNINWQVLNQIIPEVKNEQN